eukprot:1160259-Pelagomonas_calceolata.AAC.1
MYLDSDRAIWAKPILPCEKLRARKEDLMKALSRSAACKIAYRMLLNLLHECYECSAMAVAVVVLSKRATKKGVAFDCCLQLHYQNEEEAVEGGLPTEAEFVGPMVGGSSASTLLFHEMNVWEPIDPPFAAELSEPVVAFIPYKCSRSDGKAKLSTVPCL